MASRLAAGLALVVLGLVVFDFDVLRVEDLDEEARVVFLAAGFFVVEALESAVVFFAAAVFLVRLGLGGVAEGWAVLTAAFLRVVVEGF